MDEPPYRWVYFVTGVVVGFTVGMVFCVVVAWATLTYISENSPEQIPRVPAVQEGR